MTQERTIRGKVAIAGIGETTYYKHGKSPDAEFKLTLMAILAAAKDAGIHPSEIDGFASYSNDQADPARLAAALGGRAAGSKGFAGLGLREAAERHLLERARGHGGDLSPLANARRSDSARAAEAPRCRASSGESAS